MHKRNIAIILAFLIIITPFRSIQANESESILLPNHMEYQAFVIDDKLDQIYMSVISGAQSKVIKQEGEYVREHPLEKNTLLTIDRETLEIKSSVRIGSKNLALRDMEMKDGKLYVATRKEIFVYDPKRNHSEKLVSAPSERVSISQIEVTDNHIYFTDSQPRNDLNNKIVPRVYDYQLEKGTVSPIKGYSHIEQPVIGLHPDKPILYIGDSYFIGEQEDNYTLYSINLKTDETQTKQFPSDSQLTAIEIFVNHNSVYYGRYELNALDITEVRSSVKDERLRAGVTGIYKDVLLTREYMYDKSLEDPMVDLNSKRPNPLKYHIDEQQYIYQLIREVEPKKNILKKEPLSNYIDLEDKGKTNESLIFEDIDRFKDEIGYLYNTDIINGFTSTKFAPHEPIKRVDAIRMIMRDLDVDLSDVQDPAFSDIKSTTSGYKQVAKAHELGIIDGKTENQFDPTGTLTRGEMAKILANAYDLQTGYSKYFQDISEDYWAAPYISALQVSDITKGFPDQTYRPTQDITRQEFAAFMARQLNDQFK